MLIYTNKNNKPFSSWIVSDKEREIVLEYANSELEQKKSMALFSKNVDKVKTVMAGKIICQ